MKLKDWLIPQDKIFFQLLEEHVSLVLKASTLLHQSIQKNTFSQKTVTRIEKLERQADQIITDIFDRLNETFITPVDHEDLGHLIIASDDLIDLIQVSARRIQIYKLDGKNPQIKKFIAIIHTMLQESQKLVIKIKQMSQAEMRSHARKVHQLENKADDLLLSCLKQLTKENDIKKLIQEKEVFEILEALSDKIEDFCNLTQKVVMKNL